eukprot:scaffold3920_cov262-Pinguiococcus_pyrenoidosus.AAC.8
MSSPLLRGLSCDKRAQRGASARLRGAQSEERSQRRNQPLLSCGTAGQRMKSLTESVSSARTPFLFGISYGMEH